jgi:hypothetical protein
MTQEALRMWRDRIVSGVDPLPLIPNPRDREYVRHLHPLVAWGRAIEADRELTPQERSALLTLAWRRTGGGP